MVTRMRTRIATGVSGVLGDGGAGGNTSGARGMGPGRAAGAGALGEVSVAEGTGRGFFSISSARKKRNESRKAGTKNLEVRRLTGDRSAAREGSSARTPIHPPNG